MVAQRSIRGYFGALVKQQKRKGNPSAENTWVIERNIVTAQWYEVESRFRNLGQKSSSAG